jgi:hypothetical protein
VACFPTDRYGIQFIPISGEPFSTSFPLRVQRLGHDELTLAESLPWLESANHRAPMMGQTPSDSQVKVSHRAHTDAWLVWLLVTG